MRITGGTFKRREISTPKGRDTRPCSGITRESIFNILGSSVKDSVVLDLYAGSGAFGIEALSRGAAFVFFVENGEMPLKCIRQNVEKLCIDDQTKIIRRNLPSGLKALRFDNLPDLIFLDPPYSKGLVDATLLEIKKQGIYNDGTMIIVEHSKNESPDDSVFELVDRRKYGKSLISFLNHAP